MVGRVKQRIRFSQFIAVAMVLRASISLAHPGVHHDIERVSEALQKQPNRVELLSERGVYYRIAGDFEASLADFDAVARLDPSNLDVAAHRGMTLAAMGRNADAERELTRFIDGGRASGSVFAERAFVRVKLGRVEGAIADFTASLSINPDVELFIERSRLEESLGQLDQAVRGVREGLAALGGAVVLRDRLINLEILRKNYDSALQAIDDQLAVTPVKTEWLLRRAQILSVAGKAADAERDRLRALDEANRSLSKRSSAIHLVSRARANFALGRLDEAIRDLRLALDQSPRMDEAHALLRQIEAAANPGTGLSNK